MPGSERDDVWVPRSEWALRYLLNHLWEDHKLNLGDVYAREDMSEKYTLRQFAEVDFCFFVRYFVYYAMTKELFFWHNYRSTPTGIL